MVFKERIKTHTGLIVGGRGDLVFNETTNYDFILPGKTSQRHFETRAAKACDLVKNCKRLGTHSETGTPESGASVPALSKGRERGWRYLFIIVYHR